jgi:enoyl-CoA hydratase/carnithine racemase
MDDRALIQALDITLDRLTRQNADDATIRQAMSEVLKDWAAPDDARSIQRGSQRGLMKKIDTIRKYLRERI